MLTRINPFQIFHSLPVPCAVVSLNDAGFLIDEGNNAFAGLMGMTNEAFIGQNFIQLLASLNPEVAKRLTEAAEGAVSGRATVIDAIPIPRGNNRFFDIAITPLSDENNKPYCILLSATEVTEAVTLKQQAEHAEDNLEESALLMRQAQEMANFGNWRWDVLQNKVTWSDALYQIYGLDKHTFKSTFEGYQELLHPQDRQRVIEGITATLYSGNDVVFEERIIRPDGSVRHLRSWGRVQKADSGQPIRMVGACLDITESKAAEALLTDERQKHEEDTELQHRHLLQLAWLQSHVIRAPVARILGLAEVMKLGDDDEATKEESLRFIFASVEELDVLIREISAKMDSSEEN